MDTVLAGVALYAGGSLPVLLLGLRLIRERFNMWRLVAVALAAMIMGAFVASWVKGYPDGRLFLSLSLLAVLSFAVVLAPILLVRVARNR